MLARLKSGEKALAGLGLGYARLPLAVALARHFRVIGFDVSQERVEARNKAMTPLWNLAARYVPRPAQCPANGHKGLKQAWRN